MRHRVYCVYILANQSGMLYTGVTGDLARRVLEHKEKTLPGHSSRYNIRQLVYWEEFGDVREAVEREKQIKRWRRAKKVALVESVNAGWRDLAEGWEG